MLKKFSYPRRLFLGQLLLFLAACQTAKNSTQKRIIMGAVSYDQGQRTIEQYSSLIEYLGSEVKAIIELEPAYNEIKAIEQIKRGRWSLVFAPPGLAAIAISEAQYLPLLPLEGVKSSRSVIVVLQESRTQKLIDLEGKVLGLGQLGSAIGYYLPIYNLYGLTLAEVRFAPTPKTILQWLASGEVAAGAMSLAEFERYRSEFSQVQFRILHTDVHEIPSGAILVGPEVERNQQEEIRKALAVTPSSIAASAGFIPNAKVPDYQYLIEVVKRVRTIAEGVNEKPAYLFEAYKLND
ncbi:MAG: phosphate/phosphite/phosphonate ABC transporter substrate-binding protein [Symploca sp. SIO3E6]|nr:phosphate/phosphite/phosphonate ABC transporter substrate-binding protein [Caldora sp. SIO3E6]